MLVTVTLLGTMAALFDPSLHALIPDLVGAADAITFAISALALRFLSRRVISHPVVPDASVPTTSHRPSARTLLRQNPHPRAAFVVHAAGFFLNALPRWDYRYCWRITSERARPGMERS